MQHVRYQHIDFSVSFYENTPEVSWRIVKYCRLWRQSNFEHARGRCIVLL